MGNSPPILSRELSVYIIWRISPLTITLTQEVPLPIRGSFLHPVAVAMHPSRSLSRAVSAAITLTLLLIYYFALLPFVTVGSSDDAGHRQRKMVLGSKPPRCINKCLACKPCLPTLVVQGHRVVKKTLSSRDDDDGYYLLAWKCRCGNKIGISTTGNRANRTFARDFYFRPMMQGQ